MAENRELELNDYLAILRRRVWLIVLPALIVPVIAYLVSLKIPNRYTSQTLVLVEQQKVPDNFVKPVVSEELNQRLMTMKEQILSRTRLQPIIEKYGLYKNEIGKVPIEDLLDKIRKSIEVKPISDAGTRNGVPGFYISYTSDDPRRAQQICAEITSMFMDENLRARQETAQGTTDFLASQVQEAKAKLDEQDRALAAFKAKYLNQLPERDQTNMTMLTTLNSQLDATTQAIAQAGQQKTYLQTLLTQQIAAWKSKQIEGVSAPDDIDRRRAALQADLMSLQARYTPDHPDVIKAKQALDAFDKKMATGAEPKNPSARNAIEPTEIVQLRAQIKQLEDQVKSKTRDQERLQQEIATYQSRINLSPMIEEQSKKLTRDYQTAQAFYDELLAKRNQSQMATALEKQQQGEQFRVMDPPNLPERPDFPNRLKIALGALVAGLALGIGSTAALEMRDQSLKTEQDVVACLKLPVLAGIPMLFEIKPASGGMHKKARA